MRKSPAFLLAFSLLNASGAHWALVQGGAWAAMTLERSGARGWLEAFREAVGGGNPCRLCRVVEGARRSAPEPRVLPSAKLELIFPNAAVESEAPEEAPLADAAGDLPSGAFSPPSTPPPEAPHSIA